eukprot:jgi/Orpsp1_1/1175524/evm.model.c7180000054206.1
MHPNIDELRNVRNSYYRNNVYERNRRNNSERIRNRRNFEYNSSDSDSDNYENYENYENFNSNFYYRNFNRRTRNINLFEKIKIVIKKIFNKDENVVYAIIIINIIIYIAWEFAIYNQEEFYDTELLEFMENHFTISWNNLIKNKRYWTLITSMFSHKDIIHLSNNMASFYSFSIPVIRCIKKKNFIKAYLLSGICSSFAHVIFYHSIVPKLNKDVNRSILYDLLFSKYIRNSYNSISALGASGAITGINTIFACLYPSSLLTYNNYLRLPAWLTMALFIMGDFYRSLTLTNGHIDTIGHVGGGIIYILLLLRKNYIYYKLNKIILKYHLY